MKRRNYSNKDLFFQFRLWDRIYNRPVQSGASQPIAIVRLHWLERVGIIGSLFGILLTILTLSYQMAYDRLVERPIQREEGIVRAWSVVSTPAAGNSGKGPALEHLARAGEYLVGIDVSCEAMGGGWNPELGLCSRPVFLEGLELDFDHRTGLLAWLDPHPPGYGFGPADHFTLHRSDFTGANLNNSLWRGDRIVRVTFDHASMSDNWFSFTNLEGVEAFQALLWGSSFSQTEIWNSSFLEANFRNTHFFESQIFYSSFDELSFYGSTIAESRFNFVNFAGSSFVAAEIFNSTFAFSEFTDTEFCTPNSCAFIDENTSFDNAWAYAGSLDTDPRIASQMDQITQCDNRPIVWLTPTNDPDIEHDPQNLMLYVEDDGFCIIGHREYPPPETDFFVSWE